MKVLVDADACPVVDITVSVCRKWQVACTLMCDTAHEIRRSETETLVFDKGADGVDFSPEALEKIAFIESQGESDLPVIIAKTQYSLSDNMALIGRPQGFRISVRDIILKGGAGFIVAVAGKIMLMPGLSEHPAAENIDLLSDGTIVGLS